MRTMNYGSEVLSSGTLSNVDLHLLSPVLAAIKSHRASMLDRWRALYVEHFGDDRTLSDSKFDEIIGACLDALDLLRRGDTDVFVAETRKRCWAELARHGVTFAETMVLARLFEESAAAIVETYLPGQLEAYHHLHNLAHWCIPIIAETYFDFVPSQAPSISAPRQRNACCRMVGASAPMLRLYEQIEAVAQTRGTVLIIGETGTGKELVARAIHENSAQRDAPFVALNCAALPGDLIESELFGHVRGAFSGANDSAPGLFRSAEGGTLFLDEITEMSVGAQARMLRALQERRVRPVGSTSEVPVDVRVIASTNRDPWEAVESGHLRKDLYYRLQAAVIQVPPLRERLEDLPALVEHFITTLSQRVRRPMPVNAVSDEAMRAMREYHWPGNVRELSNAIETALTFGSGSVITLDDLPPSVTGRTPEEIALARQVESLAETERDLIRHALESTEGNLSAAARLLGISRKRLYARIAKYGLGSLAKSKSRL